jgi:hypothetical protein
MGRDTRWSRGDGGCKSVCCFTADSLPSSRLSKTERCEKHLELIGLFNSVFRTDEIDLVVLNGAPLRFCHRVLKSGNLLHIGNKRE